PAVHACPASSSCLPRLAPFRAAHALDRAPGRRAAHSRRLYARRVPRTRLAVDRPAQRSEEHTSELQSREKLVCRLLLGKKNESEFGTGGRCVNCVTDEAGNRGATLALGGTNSELDYRVLRPADVLQQQDEQPPGQAGVI